MCQWHLSETGRVFSLRKNTWCASQPNPKVSFWNGVGTRTYLYIRLISSRSLLKSINKHFGTLPFCRRYLDRVGETKHLLAVRSFSLNFPSYWHWLYYSSTIWFKLVSSGTIRLSVIFPVQWQPNLWVWWINLQVANALGLQEHTILLRPTVKEVVSRGDDYWFLFPVYSEDGRHMRFPHILYI